MLLAEIGTVLLALVIAIVSPDFGSAFFVGIERALARVARRRQLAVWIVGAAALLVRAAMLPIFPIPYPGLQDEFSYQLMADTFCHGRLTNPTHPLWVHFESLFVIQRPTYCSMYYPAQGLFMALGQLVGRHPFWGVWLSVGLMCAAICWMLQAWTAPLWALLGGLLAAVRIGAFSYWDNSYWGGAVTALGGALVLGALPRIKCKQRFADAILMGFGFVLLFSSRPYESLFFALPVFGAIAIWAWRWRTNIQKSLLQVALPLVLVLAAAAAFLLYYFWRTTGNPWLPPYFVNLRTYAVNPNFAWMPLRHVPQFHNQIIARHWLGWDVDQYLTVRTHPIFSLLVKILMIWFFYFGPLLSLPFLALSIALPYGTSWNDVNSKVRFLLLMCGANLVAVLLAVPSNPHYFAPVTAAIYALIVMAMQRVRKWRNAARRPGVFLVRAVPTAAVLLLLLRISIPVLHFPISNADAPWTWASPWNQLLARATIENHLQNLAGKHLVIVHYSPEHDPREGWVSNHADIDHAKIVWAQDMAEQNQELFRYFRDRQIWIVEPDKRPVRLLPYRSLGEGTKVANGREK